METLIKQATDLLKQLMLLIDQSKKLIWNACKLFLQAKASTAQPSLRQDMIELEINFIGENMDDCQKKIKNIYID